MLVVVPANVDITTTLRILTKLDLVDKGVEDKIIDLVEEKLEAQELGWVGTSKIRDTEEKFRNSPPWSRLSKDNYSIEALR
ncbi:hypothetical protein N7471_001274 [Penicillium samsonianum]|uniref:uncharacterized protein n=1 Tax=Penicillium samsonianum TaxID=1882272 RepID=UPI002546D1DB|nr:uncharacterized protein N7471_001274 [Penicillium samsonianum]KAJ6150075.1 hypothetical protein N7471_001274 [Penicillium samsonianum]